MLAPKRNPVFRMHMRACQPDIQGNLDSNPVAATAARGNLDRRLIDPLCHTSTAVPS